MTSIPEIGREARHPEDAQGRRGRIAAGHDPCYLVCSDHRVRLPLDPSLHQVAPTVRRMPQLEDLGDHFPSITLAMRVGGA